MVLDQLNIHVEKKMKINSISHHRQKLTQNVSNPKL